MDVFAHVCEALRDDDLARLRRFSVRDGARARFSTWLVTVVRNLTVDWLRHQHGRPQGAPPDSLTPRQQDVYRSVFLEHRPHLEAYELLRQRSERPLPYHAFVEDLRAAQRAFRSARHRIQPQMVSLPPSLVDPAGQEEEGARDRDEARRLLSDALAPRSPDERLALILFVVDEMPAGDVARAVGWSDAKAVYNRVYRLLKTIRRELLARGIQPDDF
jgi:RNA polymerase sigma factor (sigma-70 family)